MKNFGLLGYPLKHTLSPQIHIMLGGILGETLNYQKYEIAPEQLDRKLPDLYKLDGFNVTIPYKIRIIDTLNELDQSAKNHGAVNVVAISADGRTTGYNTDCIGFTRAMEAEGVPLTGTVCVVGGGGVGRMFATECAIRGCDVVLAVKQKHIPDCNPIALHIRQVSGRDISICNVEDLPNYNGCFDLLINATPVGMFPNVEASPVNTALLSRVNTVFDCIYNPAETLLMRQAKEAGCKVCGGMKMLVWQAVAAQELWFQKQFAPDTVDAVVNHMQNYFK